MKKYLLLALGLMLGSINFIANGMDEVDQDLKYFLSERDYTAAKRRVAHCDINASFRAYLALESLVHVPFFVTSGANVMTRSSEGKTAYRIALDELLEGLREILRGCHTEAWTDDYQPTGQIETGSGLAARIWNFLFLSSWADGSMSTTPRACLTNFDTLSAKWKTFMLEQNARATAYVRKSDREKPVEFVKQLQRLVRMLAMLKAQSAIELLGSSSFFDEVCYFMFMASNNNASILLNSDAIKESLNEYDNHLHDLFSEVIQSIQRLP